MVPAIGSTVWLVEDVTNHRKVSEDTYGAFELAEGEFLLKSYHGYCTIGRLTGRTRQFWGIDCPTVERFEVDTFVRDGVILGRAGERIAGTSAMRPEALK